MSCWKYPQMAAAGGDFGGGGGRVGVGAAFGVGGD